MQGALAIFWKEEWFFRGVESKKQILSFYKKPTQKTTQKHNGRMNGEARSSCGVAILLKKGVDCVIHSKILDPQGRYIILKAEIKDKMYVLINIYELFYEEKVQGIVIRARARWHEP